MQPVTPAATSQRLIASYLDWWAGAGVDTAFGNEAYDWLAREIEDVAAEPARPEPVYSDGGPIERRAAAPAGPAPAPQGAEPEIDRAAVLGALSSDHAAFQAQLRDPEATPFAHGLGRRVAPMGAIGAETMILIDMPGREDRDTLLSGPAGKLVQNILAAGGIAASNVYAASLYPETVVSAHLSREPDPLWIDIARHHIHLAAPKRLILLGDMTSRALLATDVLAARGRLLNFNHKGGIIPAIASFHPNVLLKRAFLKPEAWSDWQKILGSPS